jgi:hypothetical protein
MKKYFDYCLVYLILAFSVIPFFSTNKNLLVIITIFLTLISFFNIDKGTKNSGPLLMIFLLLFLMYIGQIITLRLNQIDFISIFGTYIRFLFPFLVTIIVGSSFIKKFIKLNYVLGIVVITIWLLENIYPQLGVIVQDLSRNFGLDAESNENILIYNSELKISPLGLVKSSGFAYEGGAYSIILIIALIFNYLESKSLRNRESLVFIFNLIITFSTAAFLVFFVFLISIIIQNTRRSPIKLMMIVTLVLFIAYRLVLSFSFLGDKIEEQMQIAQEDKYATRGRFASAKADLLEWQRNPIFGVGKFEESRFLYFNSEDEQHRVNGLADFLAKFGLIFFGGYYSRIYSSIRNYIIKKGIYNNSFIILIFIVVVMLSFAQIANQWPVYTIFLYLTVNTQKIT